MPEGVTLREALRLAPLQRARVVAGAAGLDRLISQVNVMEVPDILPWVKSGQLLLTTAYPLRDEHAALADLVPGLAERGLAGFAIKPTRYIEAIPPVMVEAAERLAFPLIELPPEASFDEVINAVLGSILNAQAVRLERAAAIHDRFTRIVLSGGGLREIAQTLADSIDRPTAILDPDGATLATSAGIALTPQPPLPTTRANDGSAGRLGGGVAPLDTWKPAPTTHPVGAGFHQPIPTTDSPNLPAPQQPIPAPAPPNLPAPQHPIPTTAPPNLPAPQQPTRTAEGIRAFPIQVDGELHGSIVVLDGDAALGEDALVAVEQAATVAALRLVQARGIAEADRRFQAVCLEELVAGHVTERGVLHERALAFQRGTCARLG